MNKETLKTYGKTLVLLEWAMILVNVVTVFVPFVKIDLGIVSESISGIDLIKGSVSGSLWDLLLGICTLALIGSLIDNLFSLKKHIKYISSNQVAKDTKGSAGSSMLFISIYYFLAWITILTEVEWDIGTVLSTGYISTGTHIPFFLNLALFIATHVICKNREKVIKGEANPILLFDTGKQQDEKPKEDEKIQMLSKYKELLDNGIITEQEFQEKKDEILYGGRTGEQ